MEKLRLTGRIFRDEEGIFNCECAELDIITCGDSLDDAISSGVDMVRTYLLSTMQDRTFVSEMRRLLGNPAWEPQAIEITFESQIDGDVVSPATKVVSQVPFDARAC